MGARIEIMRIAGIPIHLDITFVLLAVLFSMGYWRSGDVQLVSAGFVIVVGLFVSILLHELAHAFVGRAFGADASEIELNGMGGVCHFERSLPGSVAARTAIYLAGPAANLVLWQLFNLLAEHSAISVNPLLGLALTTLASANFLLMCFNLLPSYMLDGGQTLDAWLGPILGPMWSVRVVASLGLAVAAGLVYLAMPGNLFLLVTAFVLGMANWSALQSP